MNEVPAIAQRILVLAPVGRDGPLLAQTCADAGLTAESLDSIDRLCAEAQRGAGVAMIACEALDHASIRRLAEALSTQAPWSKLPLVLITHARSGNIVFSFSALDALTASANVTFLERPFATEVLVGTVRFALASRLGQYAVRDLTQRLDQKAADLKRSNDHLENFASIAAHDLQEPLRMVTSYTELLRLKYEELYDDKGQKWIDHISAAGKRMQRLVRSILEYSQAGRAEVTPVRVSLAAVVREALGNLESLIVERQAEIIVADLPSVIGDLTQLMVLFQNLITNAIKYSEGRPQVRIAAQDQGAEWRVSVSDNGIGIPDQDHERIFAIFTRLGRASVTGSGIGLATCRGVVERHGGRIGVESRVGQGSTFWFTLPKDRSFAAAASSR